MDLSYEQYTHIGERDENEDTVGCFNKEESCYCFVVADGLGGHGRGQEASKTIVDTFEKNFKDNKLDDIEDFFEKNFKEGQEILEKMQDDSHSIMELKTTAVALIIKDNKVNWAHIGDSRLYVFKNNKVLTRTLDHSVPQMLVFAGEIKEKHIRKHPDRNRLLKVLGAREIELKYDISTTYDMSQCQAFLLCSDGFWENITERKMCKLLKKSKDAKQWMELMKKEVIKNGTGKNMDNNSAIAIMIH